MFTVCPKCALTLVVTATDLRVAQGYVRCGRCSNVFNAIVGLSESQGSGAHGSSPSTASTSTIRKAPSITDDEPSHDSLSDTGETEGVYAEPDAGEVKFQEVFVEPEVFVEAPPPASTVARPQPPAKATAPAAPQKPPPPTAQKSSPPQPAAEDSISDTALEFNPAAMDVSKVFIETPAKKVDWKHEATGTFEQIVLKSEEPLPREEPRERDPEDVQIESELRSLAAKLDATGKQPKLTAANDAAAGASGSPYNSADEPSNRALKAAKTAKRAARPSYAAQRMTEAPADHPMEEPADAAGAGAAAQELTAPPPQPGKRIAWIGGVVALGLVLVAQAIHHNRNELATNARLNRPLTRFYAAIGVPLVPHWNLASYEVRQLGASTGEGDTGNLTVRASLRNAASQPLPLPLLRITVQDRYGNRIATRDVQPQGYVPGVVPAGAHLGVGQRIDAEMTFKDPGRDAVGFEIDACLPTANGGISCANDAATAR